jgi:ABC-type transport system substrate-binding protein
VVTKEAVSYYGDSFMNHPVGTGPFTLDLFNSQSNKVVLLKNPTFREKFYPTDASPEFQHLVAAAGKKLPFLDKVVCNIITEDQPRWLQFMDKKIDLIEVATSYIPQVFEGKKLREEFNKVGITLFKEIKPGIAYIGFNCLNKPLDNLKLRQAMSLAFDKKSYNRIFEDNLASIPHSFIPSSFAGYNKEFRNPYATYDIAKAKAYLAAAGYPDGKGLPVLTLNTSAHTTRKAQAEFFAKCMEKIGIKVAIEQTTFPELSKKIHQGQFLISMLGVSADFPDAIDILSLLRRQRTGFRIKDLTFNALYEQAIAMEDSPEKTALYEKLNEMATELTPALLRPLMPKYVLTHARVKNYHISPYHFGIEQYLDVEES